MAVKAVYDIDVNDAAFVKFQAAFDKYQKALDKMPSAWKSVNKESVKVNTPFAEMTAALTTQNRLLKANLESQKQIQRSAAVTDRSMGSLARRTGHIAKNLASASLSMIKWASLGLAGGLLGGGGLLFGVDRLAASAGRDRRSALGLGITSGQQQAFNVNYSRFFDPNSVLSNIANARNDLSQRWIFNSMGISGLDHKNNAQIGVESALKAKRIFEEGGQTQQYAQARGLLNIYTMDDLRRLHLMSEQEIKDAGKKYYIDQKQFTVSTAIQQQWQNLTRQLERSGTTIKDTLITKLAPLGPALDRLSKAFTSAIDNLLNTKTLKTWINQLSVWVTEFSKYLASPQFKTDMRSFVVGIEDAARALSGFVRWVEGLGFWKKSPSQWGGDLGLGGYTSSVGYAGTTKKRSIGNPVTGWDVVNSPSPGSIDTSFLKSDPKKQAYLSALEKKYNLQPGTLDAVWKAESSRGAILSTSKAGAMGQFQFMPDTARQYGLKNPNSFHESADAAARYLHDLKTRFHLTSAALAAYNWGPGNLQNDMNRYAGDWRRHLPKETSDYLNRTGSTIAGHSITIVEINNNTGGSASVTSSSVAAQR